MKLNAWNWFTATWSKVIGQAIMALTKADGKEGLSWADVQITVELIKNAEVQFGTGAEKRAWVVEQIKNLRGIVLPHVVELLFWVALNYAKEKVFIALGGQDVIKK